MVQDDDPVLDLVWQRFAQLENVWLQRLEDASKMAPGEAREKVLIDGAFRFLGKARRMQPSSTERAFYAASAKLAIEILLDGNKSEGDRRQVYLGDVSGRKD